MALRFLDFAYRESGLASVASTGRDAVLVILARSCRMIAYGSSSLVLSLFLASLPGVSDARIGLFMTLTLAGDVVLSLALTLLADRLGRRRTLLLGALMMIASGTAFALFENYWVLLLAAVVGVLSATGGDFGPFRAIEESVISQLTQPETRADVLVWYVTTASLGSSVGTELAGRVIEWLRASRGWELVDCYHACFWSYVAMGLVNVCCGLALSKRCELQSSGPEKETAEGLTEAALPADSGAATAGKAAVRQRPKKRWLAQISRETRSIMLALWFLLMVDSLADGITNMSLTTYYLDRKFHVAKSTLGDVLSASYFLCTVSTIFAGPLARRIGLVNTMVFTHIPSSAAVLLFPFPDSVTLTFGLLLLRVGLNNMDQAPRAALIAAVVKPEERTSVMGITSMLRTVAATTGPTVTGILAEGDKFWIAFVVAGSLRLAYDLGLFAMFIDINLHKYEAVRSKDTEAEGEPTDPDEEDIEEDGDEGLQMLSPRPSN